VMVISVEQMRISSVVPGADFSLVRNGFILQGFFFK